MEKLFRLSEKNTTIRKEVLAGLTTFFTMAYIIFVNPAVLSAAGVPFDQVFVATIFSAALGTLILALGANYPIAIAPGMGLNAYFTTVVATQGLNYNVVFSAVFVTGILFFLLSLTKLRVLIIEAIPETLKHSITAGIGLFIAFLGLKMAGLVVANESNLLAFGDIKEPSTILSIVGIIITMILVVRKVPGALFIGMAITAIISFIIGDLKFDGIMSLPPKLQFIDLDIGSVFSNGLFMVIIAFLLVTIFDTTGTMVGVAEQANLLKDGKLPRAKLAFLADSSATALGSLLGTSPSTAYVESSSGVAAGGRTGLTALVVSIMFILSLFFSPFVSAISSISAITAPTLIIVGSFMLGGLAKIKWQDASDAIPAFLVIIMMPFSSSISTGISIGFITYSILKLSAGEGKKVHPLIYIFAIIFILQMIFF